MTKTSFAGETSSGTMALGPAITVSVFSILPVLPIAGDMGVNRPEKSYLNPYVKIP
jgi:hypothetical protein